MYVRPDSMQFFVLVIIFAKIYDFVVGGMLHFADRFTLIMNSVVHPSYQFWALYIHK